MKSTKTPHCWNSPNIRIGTERGNISTSSTNTQLNDLSLSWVCTGTSIKSDGSKKSLKIPKE